MKPWQFAEQCVAHDLVQYGFNAVVGGGSILLDRGKFDVLVNDCVRIEVKSSHSGHPIQLPYKQNVRENDYDILAIVIFDSTNNAEIIYIPREVRDCFGENCLTLSPKYYKKLKKLSIQDIRLFIKTWWLN